MESVTSSLCRAASTADTTEDDLRQLENALQPLKEDLINSSITYAKHMESLANFSVEIRRGLSKTLSNQAVLEQVAGRVLMTFPSVIRVMSLAYLWLADSLGKDDILSRTQSSTMAAAAAAAAAAEAAAAATRWAPAAEAGVATPTQAAVKAAARGGVDAPTGWGRGPGLHDGVADA